MRNDKIECNATKTMFKYITNADKQIDIFLSIAKANIAICFSAGTQLNTNNNKKKHACADHKHTHTRQTEIDTEIALRANAPVE